MVRQAGGRSNCDEEESEETKQCRKDPGGCPNTDSQEEKVEDTDEDEDKVEEKPPCRTAAWSNDRAHQTSQLEAHSTWRK